MIEPLDFDTEVRRTWREALSAWSLLTQLREPELVDGDPSGNIAYIRLRDARIVLSRDKINELGLVELTRELLAHEIGHHVYVPGNWADHVRMLAQMAPIFEGLPAQAMHVCGNLYSDLLINDRLVRRANLKLPDVYRKLKEHGATIKHDDDSKAPPASRVWSVYMRICEHLWRTPDGWLTPSGEPLSTEAEGDALLASRLIRTFAGDWLRGARRFASVMYKYFAEDKEAGDAFSKHGLFDLGGAGEGLPDQLPDGLSEDLGEGDDGGGGSDANGFAPRDASKQGKSGGGQARTPFQYRQLLQRLGLTIDEVTATARYYRERALPHLLPFPRRSSPRTTEPIPEGTVPWESTDALESLDLPATLGQSPIVIPGVTTVQRVYGDAPGHDPAPRPMDLDIYVDCSGSMPDPRSALSYLTLAATILGLSALRAGASVQATLWAHAGCFDTTNGFIRDEKRLLGLVTSYLSGGTAFPLHILRDTYAKRSRDANAAHVVVISDDGVNTMLQEDEQKTPGAAVVKAALARARGGCTLVLNLGAATTFAGRDELVALGCSIYTVQAWEDLIAFARAFVRKTYL